jgi:hypothetical protein
MHEYLFSAAFTMTLISERRADHSIFSIILHGPEILESKFRIKQKSCVTTRNSGTGVFGRTESL